MPGDQKPDQSYYALEVGEILDTIVDDIVDDIMYETRLSRVLAELVRSYFVSGTFINWESLLTYKDIEGHPADWAGVSLAAPFAAMREQCRGEPEVLDSRVFDGAIFGEGLAENKFDRTLPPKEMWSKVPIRSRIQESDLARTSVSFVKALLKGARFDGLICKNLNFADATLTDASFRFCILLGASFAEANMSGADLSFANGARYNYTAGSNALGQHTRLPFLSDFSETNLANAVLYRGNFCRLTFDKTIFDNADLSEALFSSAVFNECSMQSARLAGSRCYASSFIGSNLLRVDARGADFRRANLTEADLTDAKFTGANMWKAQLTRSYFCLRQFTKEQVLSFSYKDPDAVRYIEAIYQYAQQMPETNHEQGLGPLTSSLIRAFINQTMPGKNELFARFLLTGCAPGESGPGLRGAVRFRLFGKNNEPDDENSLRGRLLVVRDQIEQEKSAGQEQKVVPAQQYRK